MFTMCKLSSYGRNIGIQDDRHIIRHAVFHDRLMSLTLSVVTDKVVISPFRSDLKRLPSEEHLRWQSTRKLLAYRESTHTILSVTFPYFMCNPPNIQLLTLLACKHTPLISYSLQMAAIFNFTMTVSLSILRYLSTYYSSSRLLSYSKSRHICKVGCIPGLP